MVGHATRFCVCALALLGAEPSHGVEDRRRLPGAAAARLFGRNQLGLLQGRAGGLQDQHRRHARAAPVCPVLGRRCGQDTDSGRPLGLYRQRFVEVPQGQPGDRSRDLCAPEPGHVRRLCGGLEHQVHAEPDTPGDLCAARHRQQLDALADADAAVPGLPVRPLGAVGRRLARAGATVWRRHPVHR